MIPYEQFLARKSAIVAPSADALRDFVLSEVLKPHQHDIAAWAIAGGRRAIFADFGLGKTIIQMQIVVALVAAYGGSSLIVCPLGVRQEFTRDAKRFFGVDVHYFRTNDEHAAAVAAGGKYFITNYERVRDGQLDLMGACRFCKVSVDCP